MMLSDFDIKKAIKDGELVIKPFKETQIGPASYDLLLGNKIRIFKPTEHACIDVKNYRDDFKYIHKTKNKIIEHCTYTDLITSKDPFVLHQGEFVLCDTVEYFEFSKNLAGQLMGKSSIGRLGVIVHVTAGFFDPGFKGFGTLEMANLGKISVKFYPGMKIAQMAFYKLITPCKIPYNERKGSKYIKNNQAAESRISQDFNKKK